MEIQLLSSDVVDKIAAGEVVERPAHLLKELLENSLDAGATKIEVEIDEGGKSLSVTDDGKGVLKKELPLVFARHATSKIEESEDLWKLSTFGFRGEAIASISSVSRLDFISRRKGEKKGYKIQCEFGSLSDVSETSAQEGTTVRIQDLFSNIPARLKFLKSDSAEVTQIKNVIKAMAMQYPHVEWKVKSKGKLLFVWKGGQTPLERAQSVLDTKKLYEHKKEFEGFNAHVIFSDPSNVTKVSRQIWIFVQNRWVQDRGIQAAVMEAYRNLLMHGQYPICYVSLECPPDEVDVNIHPTKSQVKFIDAKKAFRAVHYCLREAIEKAPWQTKTPSYENKVIAAPVEKTDSFESFDLQRTQFQQKTFSKPQFEQTQSVYSPKVGMEELKQASQREEVKSLDVEKPQGYWSTFQVVGQVDLTYIVVQDKEKMMLVDQHAAHERVAFERLMNSWKNGNMEVQSFLLPLTVDLEEPEVETLVEMTEELSTMGISIEQAGPSTIAIASLPSIIKEAGLVEALKKLAKERLDKGGSFALEVAIGDIFATMACHSVVRAGQSLSREQMENLLTDMDEFPLSGFCPHGRSVSIDWSFVHLEKEFGRRG